LRHESYSTTLPVLFLFLPLFTERILAIYPLGSNKPVDKVKDKIEETTSVLPPANYTMIMGKKENKVVIKFHKQASELHLKNISTEESNCLLNGGGLNCVLATAY
jgi:hypothetical protein